MSTSSTRAARWAVSVIACLAIGLRLAAAEASPKPPAVVEAPRKQPVATAETFVYVHGAWNGSYGLKNIERLLRAAGKEVYRPALTGLGERVHLANASIDLDTHIQDVVNVIVWEDLRDVVLVGRSYGGMVIAGVIDRVPERIKRVIYLDAFLPVDGESMLDLNPQTKVQEDGFVAMGRAIRPPEGAAPPHALNQPGKTFSQKIRLRNPEAAARIPTTYLLTVEAGKKPEEDAFFKYAERARARGWKIVTMEAGHAPEGTHPNELLPLLITP